MVWASFFRLSRFFLSRPSQSPFSPDNQTSTVHRIVTSPLQHNSTAPLKQYNLSVSNIKFESDLLQNFTIHYPSMIHRVYFASIVSPSSTWLPPRTYPAHAQLSTNNSKWPIITDIDVSADKSLTLRPLEPDHGQRSSVSECSRNGKVQNRNEAAKKRRGTPITLLHCSQRMWAITVTVSTTSG